jgi:hypothetical protein
MTEEIKKPSESAKPAVAARASNGAPGRTGRLLRPVLTAPAALGRGALKMTHETKAGLVVTASFLGLVGVVLYCKMKEAEPPVPAEYIKQDGSGALDIPPDPTLSAGAPSPGIADGLTPNGGLQPYPDNLQLTSATSPAGEAGHGGGPAARGTHDDHGTAGGSVVTTSPDVDPHVTGGHDNSAGQAPASAGTGGAAGSAGQGSSPSSGSGASGGSSSHHQPGATHRRGAGGLVIEEDGSGGGHGQAGDPSTLGGRGGAGTGGTGTAGQDTTATSGTTGQHALGVGDSGHHGAGPAGHQAPGARGASQPSHTPTGANDGHNSVPAGGDSSAATSGQAHAGQHPTEGTGAAQEATGPTGSPAAAPGAGPGTQPAPAPATGASTGDHAGPDHLTPDAQNDGLPADAQRLPTGQAGPGANAGAQAGAAGDHTPSAPGDASASGVAGGAPGSAATQGPARAGTSDVLVPPPPPPAAVPGDSGSQHGASAHGTGGPASTSTGDVAGDGHGAETSGAAAGTTSGNPMTAATGGTPGATPGPAGTATSPNEHTQHLPTDPAPAAGSASAGGPTPAPGAASTAPAGTGPASGGPTTPATAGTGGGGGVHLGTPESPAGIGTGQSAAPAAGVTSDVPGHVPSPAPAPDDAPPNGSRATPTPNLVAQGTTLPDAATQGPQADTSRPPLGAAATAGTAPIAVPMPPSASTDTAPHVESYDEEMYRCQADDVVGPDPFAVLSKRYYQSEKYARALALYNRNHPQVGDGIRSDPPVARVGDAVFIPPLRILEARYANAIPASTPAAAPAAPQGGTPAPTGTQSGLANPAGERLYRVQSKGEYMYTVAQRTLPGNPDLRWREIWGLNPKPYNPQDPLPVGTVLWLPADAHVPPDNVP